MEGAVVLRHQLHQEPELTWQEEGTAATIRRNLDALGIPWRPCARTGTVGMLAARAPRAHIALRGDIDALPILESTGLPWSSKRNGVMHACGHDGHTATLMATAAWLKLHEDRLSGPVSLLFQPAEEGGHGAQRMIEEGALEGVDCIYGWHNWPAIPFGQAVCPDGTVMCANGTFAIHLQGRGGHASQPETCRDPVLAGAAITQALQQIVSRRLPPQAAAVVSVTNIIADATDTVIPEQAVVRGGIRTSTTAMRQRVEQLIDEIACACASAHGVEARVEHSPRYGATVNHPGPAQTMRQALADTLGPACLSEATPLPIMASEDFSYYLEVVPGAFALVGAGRPEVAASPSCHSPHYDFHDGLIPAVVACYSRLCGVEPGRI